MSERFAYDTRDFSRIDVMYDTFASGDADAVERMRVVNGWSEEETALYNHYVRMRARMRSQADEDARERMERQPVALPFELMMGTYIEQIEPQVRDAVRVLHDSGYGTVSSGFYGLNAQEMVFAGQGLGAWWFDDAYLYALSARGVVLKRLGDRFLFELYEVLSDEELTLLWMDIVVHIPKSGRIPDASGTGNARRFREAQRVLRQRMHIRDNIHT